MGILDNWSKVFNLKRSYNLFNLCDVQIFKMKGYPMSEAEWVDYDYECFQQAEDLRNISLLNQDWEYLQSKGFIWRDIHGNCYKPKSIKDSHLKNILNHCKTHYRPVEQVEALQNLWYERLNKQPLNLKRK